MFIEVITRVAKDTALDVVEQRNVLTTLFNDAARELHLALECNRIFRETTLVVPANKVISLPAFIGEIRGLRIFDTEQIFDLKSMAVPRYTNTTLQYRIKNWRDLGESCLQENTKVIAPLQIQTTIIQNPPVTVTIVGQTNNASRVEEKVSLTDYVVSTINSFGPSIYNISSMDERQCDISIVDDNGCTISTLYNKQVKAKYKLIDVSQVFWPQNDTSKGQTLINVLYKLPFIPCINDTDSFAAGDDYDNAIYHFMMYLYYLPIEGKEGDAQLAKQQAFTSLKLAKDGSEEGIDKKLNFGRGKFYGLFKRRFASGHGYGGDYNYEDSNTYYG